MGSGRLTNARSRRDDETEEEARNQELGPGGHTAGLMPAVPPMAREELAAARTEKPDDVLGVRRRRSRCAENRRVERAAQSGQGGQHEHAGTKLEPP
jgi:hypothetical protein